MPLETANEMRDIDIKNSALAGLRTARLGFYDDEFIESIKSADKAVRIKAAKSMLAVEEAYQTLLRTQIDGIREKLQENKAAIEKATKSLKGKLNGLKKAEAFLKGVASLLSAIGKIVALVF